jgi:hypothetical protein
VISMRGANSREESGKSRGGAIQSLLDSREALKLTVLSGFLLGFTDTQTRHKDRKQTARRTTVFPFTERF